MTWIRRLWAALRGRDGRGLSINFSLHFGGIDRAVRLAEAEVTAPPLPQGESLARARAAYALASARDVIERAEGKRLNGREVAWLEEAIHVRHREAEGEDAHG